MIQTDSTMEITRKLLIALGLEIQQDTNMLYNQDTKSALFFEGLAIKANIDPNKSLFIGENEVRFEPLDPKYTKLMERMFGQFLEDSEENGYTTHCTTYYFDMDTSGDVRKYRLTIKFAPLTPGVENRWEGNWYINKVIGFTEAIFAIDGTFDDVNLLPYDINYDLIEEEEVKKVYLPGDEELQLS